LLLNCRVNHTSVQRICNTGLLQNPDQKKAASVVGESRDILREFLSWAPRFAWYARIALALELKDVTFTDTPGNQTVKRALAHTGSIQQSTEDCLKFGIPPDGHSPMVASKSVGHAMSCDVFCLPCPLTD